MENLLIAAIVELYRSPRVTSCWRPEGSMAGRAGPLCEREELLIGKRREETLAWARSEMAEEGNASLLKSIGEGDE